MLFTMYIKPLSAIIDSHSIIHHSFADDIQLQMSAPPDRITIGNAKIPFKQSVKNLGLHWTVILL